MLDALVVATRNPHKTGEIRSMLAGLHVRVQDMGDFPACPDVEETGATLEENALLKARAAHQCTGLPVIADDSGLEVSYLLGAPGVYSARYSGPGATFESNNRALLRALTQVPARRRDARFRCVIAFVDGRQEHLFEGRIEGNILLAPRGSNGFGYDPVFRPLGMDRSLAELSPEEKNRISHRARAMEQFIASLTASASSLR